jgi:hypothetical protein
MILEMKFKGDFKRFELTLEFPKNSTDLDKALILNDAKEQMIKKYLIFNIIEL